MNETENVSADLQPNVKATPTPLTFGEQLVGLTFNPSGDQKVIMAKKF